MRRAVAFLVVLMLVVPSVSAAPAASEERASGWLSQVWVQVLELIGLNPGDVERDNPSRPPPPESVHAAEEGGGSMDPLG